MLGLARVEWWHRAPLCCHNRDAPPRLRAGRNHTMVLRALTAWRQSVAGLWGYGHCKRSMAWVSRRNCLVAKNKIKPHCWAGWRWKICKAKFISCWNSSTVLWTVDLLENVSAQEQVKGEQWPGSQPASDNHLSVNKSWPEYKRLL